MSDRENITLPRVVVQEALEALQYAGRRPGGSGLYTQEIAALRAHLAAPRPEPEPVRHPGYVIGSHWFETAYERLCAGEAEDAILEDYELAREPRLRDLRRDAERYRYLRNRDPAEVMSKEGKDAGCWIDCEEKDDIAYKLQLLTGDDADAAIDAAMEPATEPAIRARGEVPR